MGIQDPFFFFKCLKQDLERKNLVPKISKKEKKSCIYICQNTEEDVEAFPFAPVQIQESKGLYVVNLQNKIKRKWNTSHCQPKLQLAMDANNEEQNPYGFHRLQYVIYEGEDQLNLEKT